MERSWAIIARTVGTSTWGSRSAHGWLDAATSHSGPNVKRPRPSVMTVAASSAGPLERHPILGELGDPPQLLPPLDRFLTPVAQVDQGLPIPRGADPVDGPAEPGEIGRLDERTQRIGFHAGTLAISHGRLRWSPDRGTRTGTHNHIHALGHEPNGERLVATSELDAHDVIVHLDRECSSGIPERSANSNTRVRTSSPASTTSPVPRSRSSSIIADPPSARRSTSDAVVR